MCSHLNVLKNRLYQVNQEFISYGIYEIVILTEIIDTVINFKKRTTLVEKEPLTRTHIINKFQLSRTDNALPDDYK